MLRLGEGMHCQPDHDDIRLGRKHLRFSDIHETLHIVQSDSWLVGRVGHA